MTRRPGTRTPQGRPRWPRWSLWLATLLPWGLGLSACTNAGGGGGAPPITPVAQVELPRFMGDWYVIASIPSFIEREAFDAVETYALKADGRVQTTFRYRNGGHDAPLKTLRPVGTVKPGTNNAVWGMQFIWPVQAEYLIAYVDEAYGQTIVGRNARDYVWLMARTPSISDADYQAHLARIQAMGYDIAKLRKVPQQAAAAPKPVPPN